MFPSAVTATLEHNRQRLAARIDVAARAAGRETEELCVVAITKYVEHPTALALARLGQRDFGENRAEELEAKARALREADVRVRWHFVGHLQRNKARRVAKIADVIHSVDTPRLIRSLNAVAGEEGRDLEVFLEVRLTDEPTKHGFPFEQLREGVDALRDAPHLRPLGLMGMSPADGGSEAATAAFTRLRDLADELEQDPDTRTVFADERVRTSMGMSGDFHEAIAAGADYLRIGSSFFENNGDTAREVPA